MSLVMTCCHLLLLSFFVLPDPPGAAVLERGRMKGRQRERETEIRGGGGPVLLLGCLARPQLHVSWLPLVGSCYGSLLPVWGPELCPVPSTLWALKPHVHPLTGAVGFHILLGLAAGVDPLVWGHSGGL